MRNISDETSIPRQLFSFVDFKKLALRDKQDEFLTDVIGFYNNIGELQKNIHTRMGQSDKKSIYIDNERYKVQFEIEDSTCKKLITTFDDEAEYLLQRPLDELLEIEKQGIKIIKQDDEEPNAKKQCVEIQLVELEVKGWLLEWLLGWWAVKWMIWVLKVVDKAGYKTPSPIRMAAIPLGLQRDVIGIVEPGQANRSIFLEEDRVKAETERAKAPVDFTTFHNFVV
ncbi:hypothetical protein IFM89_012656 [Coptis chinensis]|uniref:Uncharacterized protein n=1 Tax=Coptis chinensis TaxID=261450 RepID=A0A835LH06_9MAGN|nr:hypothetical protein IFM89_012656 [Coptis chinensis]